MLNDPYADLYLANHAARAEEERRAALVASAETAREELRAAVRAEGVARLRSSFAAGSEALRRVVERRVVERRAPSAHHQALVASIYGSDVDPLSTKHTPPQRIKARPTYPTNAEASQSNKRRAVVQSTSQPPVSSVPPTAPPGSLTASAGRAFNAANSGDWFIWPARRP